MGVCYTNNWHVLDGRAMFMNIKLNSKIILEKEFSKGFKGYNSEEVDQFLDEIIQDYDAFEQVVAELQEENRRLKEALENTSKKQSSTQQVNGTTNFDILKRLSNLEKHVFGNKLYD